MPSGSPLPTRFPSDSYAGNRVNDALAYLASAIRNLGDQAVKLRPGEDDGTYELGPNNGQIGSMAWQDADDVDIAGGLLGTFVRGSVPIRVILPWWGTFELLEQVYPNIRARGFDICDGRVSSNPVNSSQTFVMPNLLDHYIYFYVSPSDIGRRDVFAHVKNTSAAGAHGHGGTTGGTAITGAQSPTLSKTTGTAESGGDVTVMTNVAYGGPGSTHAHAISTEAAHAHSVDVRPRSAVCVPIMRVW
jgi:hypothetical protein